MINQLFISEALLKYSYSLSLLCPHKRITHHRKTQFYIDVKLNTRIKRKEKNQEDQLVKDSVAGSSNLDPKIQGGEDQDESARKRRDHVKEVGNN